MEKILIISYNFVPYNITNAFRMTRFAKYLQNFRWQPYVLTSYHGSEDINEKLLDVFPKNISILRKPYPFSYGNNSPQTIFTPSRKGIFLTILRLSKDLFASPDKFIFWSYRVLPSAIRLIKKEKIKYVWVTGGPFSLFVLGGVLKKLLKIQLILDYRDPWHNNPHQIHQSQIRQIYNALFEKWALITCDYVTSTTQKILDDITKRYSLTLNSKVIPNGFDRSSFDLSALPSKNNDLFTFCYVGVFDILHRVYSPQKLLQAISILKQKYQKRFRFVVIGKTSSATQNYIEQLNLHQEIELRGYCPREITRKIESTADIFLHFYYPSKLNDTLSSKLFEYAQFKKPILSMSATPSEISQWLEKTQLGYVCDNDDVETFSEILNDAMDLDLSVFQQNINQPAIDRYEIHNLTREFTEFILGKEADNEKYE